jgi:hypothetical protein
MLVGFTGAGVECRQQRGTVNLEGSAGGIDV